MALLSALCELSDYKLVHLNFRSYNGEVVKLQSAVNDDCNNFSGKINNVSHFRAHNWKILPKPYACTFTSEQFSLFHSATQRNAAILRKVLAPFLVSHVIAINSCSLLSRSFPLSFFALSSFYSN